MSSLRILSLILWLVGVPALCGAIAFASGGPILIAPSRQKVDPQLAKVLLVVLGLAYAVSALASAYAAGRSLPWVRRSYRAFGVSIVCYVTAFLYIVPIPWDTFSLTVGPLVFLLIGLALWRGWRVIDRNVARQR